MKNYLLLKLYQNIINEFNIHYNKCLLIVTLLLLSTPLFSQSYHFSESVMLADFVKTMSATQMPFGYTFLKADLTEGDVVTNNKEYIDFQDYNANFTNEKVRGSMTVKLTTINNFDLHFGRMQGWYSEGVYNFDGREAIYITCEKKGNTGIQTGFGIKLTNINAALTILIMADTAYKQKDIEAMVRAININLFDNNKAEWDSDVATKYRIPGKLIKIIKTPVNSDEIEEEYHIIVAKSSDWIKDLKKFLTKLDGSLESTTIDNWVIICKNAVTYDLLEKIPNDKQVEFIYYKLKK